jgi:hypothetical protein
MERRIWLYLLEHEVLELEFIGKVDVLGKERYAALGSDWKNSRL